jgi:hypothetical protein
VKAAIHHDQHVGRDGAQQTPGPRALVVTAGPEASVGHGVSAALHQADTPHLGKAPGPRSVVGRPKTRALAGAGHGLVRTKQAQPVEELGERGLDASVGKEPQSDDAPDRQFQGKFTGAREVQPYPLPDV